MNVPTLSQSQYHILTAYSLPHRKEGGRRKESATDVAIGMQRGYEQIGVRSTVFAEYRTKRARFKQRDQI